MNQTTIKVSDYYGNPSYYSVMPQVIFDALEEAALNDIVSIDVDKSLLDKMNVDYKVKMNAL